MQGAFQRLILYLKLLTFSEPKFWFRKGHFQRMKNYRDLRVLSFAKIQKKSKFEHSTETLEKSGTVSKQLLCKVKLTLYV